MALDAQQAELNSQRLLLRPLQLQDAEALHHLYADEQTMAYWSSAPVHSLEESLASVQADLDWVAAGQAAVWAVLLRDTAAVVGKFVLFNHHQQNQRAELGFVLKRQYWRQGLMTEACTSVIDFSFNRLGLHRLEADADENNAGSIALLEKLGFQREGFCPERWRVNGQWQNSLLFGLLKQQWLQRQPG
jgi:RimJ/RimL family protein N-acetyltransferase